MSPECERRWRVFFMQRFLCLVVWQPVVILKQAAFASCPCGSCSARVIPSISEQQWGRRQRAPRTAESVCLGAENHAEKWWRLWPESDGDASFLLRQACKYDDLFGKVISASCQGCAIPSLLCSRYNSSCEGSHLGGPVSPGHHPLLSPRPCRMCLCLFPGPGRHRDLISQFQHWPCLPLGF